MKDLPGVESVTLSLPANLLALLKELAVYRHMQLGPLLADMIELETDAFLHSDAELGEILAKHLRFKYNFKFVKEDA